MAVTNVKDELKRLATEQTQRGGVRSVTLRDLGRAVGIKSPSVLYHFKNKDTLSSRSPKTTCGEFSRR
jgi:AcrR family transcriptional regulator